MNNRTQLNFLFPASIISALISTWELSHLLIPSIVLGLTALALLVYGVVKYRKDNAYFAFSIITCSIMMIIILFIGYYRNINQKKIDALYISFQQNSTSTKSDNLKKQADKGDHSAQFRYATKLLDDFEFSEAMNYFQKAADAGNGVAYAMLADMYLKGLGGEVDIHRAVSNIIKARQIQNIVFVDLEKHPDYGKITEMEKEALAITDVELDYLTSICEEMKGSNDSWSILKSHHDDINKLSLKGYIIATEMLYWEEMHNAPQDIVNLKQITQMLYNKNHIPTNPFQRSIFFEHYYGTNEYNIMESCDNYIKDNYYMPASFDAQMNHDYSKYSDNLLLEAYKYCLARYKWNKAIKNGTQPTINYIFFVGDDDIINQEIKYSTSILQDVINEIQTRKKKMVLIPISEVNRNRF